MAEAKNALGEEILVDPTTPPDQRADHPAAKDLKGDDKVSGTVVGDAELEDPPVRTARPDVPIIQRLGTGAGQHTPLVDDDFDETGRYTPTSQAAIGAPGEAGAASKAEQDKAAKS